MSVIFYFPGFDLFELSCVYKAESMCSFVRGHSILQHYWLTGPLFPTSGFEPALTGEDFVLGVGANNQECCPSLHHFLTHTDDVLNW